MSIENESVDRCLIAIYLRAIVIWNDIPFADVSLILLYCRYDVKPRDCFKEIEILAADREQTIHILHFMFNLS